MSRVLKRPMFKMGGSTGEGITSGLSRRGYKEAGSVDWGEVDVIADQMKKRYGAVPRQGYNVWDFLTEWGLNMASSPPMGNVIQTAAGTARGPYSKMVEGKGKDEEGNPTLSIFMSGEEKDPVPLPVQFIETEAVDPADIDIDATDVDVKAAEKNIIMQMRKVQSFMLPTITLEMCMLRIARALTLTIKYCVRSSESALLYPAGSAARPAVHQLIGLGHGGVYIDRNASAIKYGQVAAQRFIALASCVRIAYSG